MKPTLDFSIIIPVYRETDSLLQVCQQFAQVIGEKRSYEIIFVNDGNIANDTYHALEALRSDHHVRVIHLSRNFGQHAAIAAGMKNCHGNYAIVMDADLQYLPDDVYRMYLFALEQQKPAVLSVLRARKDSIFKSYTSRVYYKIMTWLGVDHRPNLGSAFIVHRHVISGLLRMNDRYRMTIPMIHWLIGDIGYYEMSHYARKSGRSGYNLSKLIAHAVNGVTGFSAKPLYLSIFLSLVFGTLAGLLGVFLLVKRVLLSEAFLAGWLSTVLILLVSASFILGCLGIIGIYLGKIFEMLNARPLYYVQHMEKELVENKNVKLFEDI